CTEDSRGDQPQPTSETPSHLTPRIVGVWPVNKLHIFLDDMTQIEVDGFGTGYKLVQCALVPVRFCFGAESCGVTDAERDDFVVSRLYIITLGSGRLNPGPRIVGVWPVNKLHIFLDDMTQIEVDGFGTGYKLVQCALVPLCSSRQQRAPPTAASLRALRVPPSAFAVNREPPQGPGPSSPSLEGRRQLPNALL
ncbi:unnamed protein product, partial [Gadus morhua 'NCC']